MLSKVVILLLLGCFLRSSSVAGILTTNINDVNGTLTVCPGEFISITCTHDNAASGVTRWTVDGSTPAVTCTRTVSHGDPADTDCGLFAITMISDFSGPTFNSTAQTTATEALNGAMVECFSSGAPNSLVGNITINVLSIPTPTIDSVEQDSQSVVRVSMSVSDSQCVGSYQVEATPVGGSGSTNTNSPTSTVDASGLDVCQYNYTLVGFVLTADGVQSDPSSPESFSADLSVINGITVTVNQLDPLIEWEQMPNPSYPTCITGYFVDGQTGFNTTASSTTRSLTAQQLNAAGFPYCTIIYPTVTPVTPMGPLEMLTETSNVNTTLLDPDFPTPMLYPSFSLDNGTVSLTITIQNVSETVVPERLYRYNVIDGAMSPMMNLTSDSFVIELPGVEAGQVVRVAVRFTRDSCSINNKINFTVPPMEITDVEKEEPTDTSQSITVTLPLTEYQPEQLLIISTVEPSDDGPIMANYTSPSMEYTVTFTDLDPATEYTFTIRIVLRSDNTVDVVQAFTGTFTTAPTPTTTTTEETPSPTPAGAACGGGCIAGIIVAIILVVIIIVVIVVILVLVCVVIPKQKSKEKVEPGKQELSTIKQSEGVKVEIVTDEEVAESSPPAGDNQFVTV